jgi:hypothetical protein
VKVLSTDFLRIGQSNATQSSKNVTTDTLNIETVIEVGKSSKASSYQALAKFVFGGTALNNKIISIKGVFYMQSGGSNSYSVRIYDVTNGNIIAEITGADNTSAEIVDLGNVSNLPENEAILEIQVKSTGNKRAYCDSVTFTLGE